MSILIYYNLNTSWKYLIVVSIWQEMKDNSDRRISRQTNELLTRKPVFGVSDQVRHKSGSTIAEDG